MVKTTAEIVAYTKAIDVRLASMTDTAVLDLISTGIHYLSAQANCFSKNQTYPLAQYVTAGIYTISIVPQEPVIDYYSIQAIITATGEKANVPISFERTQDKNLIVKLPENTYDVSNVSVSVSYFYYLDVITGGTYTFENNIWSLMIDCINIKVWNYLKDYEKEKYHDNQFKTHVAIKSIQIPDEIQSYQTMKGGFL